MRRSKAWLPGSRLISQLVVWHRHCNFRGGSGDCYACDRAGLSQGCPTCGKTSAP